MGNLCPWCKSADDSESTNNLRDTSALTTSQRSENSSEANDRTPLLSKSSSHNQYHQPVSPTPNTTTNAEPSSFLTTIVPPPLPPPAPIINNNHTESTRGKVAANEAAENTMATIVDRMLPDLIDVGGWGAAGPTQTHPHPQNFSAENDHLKQILSKSLQSTRLLALPDSGTTNLSSLLSNRPISSETCHFVSHTANDLSRLLIDEIKIIHKGDLVVTFE